MFGGGLGCFNGPQIKVIIRQADSYDKTGDAIKCGRGYKI